MTGIAPPNIIITTDLNKVHALKACLACVHVFHLYLKIQIISVKRYKGMFYQPISLREAIEDVNKTWYLPAIQRPYDWGERHKKESCMHVQYVETMEP